MERRAQVAASLLVVGALACASTARAAAEAGQDALMQAHQALDAGGDLAAARASLAPLAAQRGDAKARDLAARASFLLAEIDERERSFELAQSHYADVIRIDPGNYYAGTARVRLEALARYGGAFGELATLDALRKDRTRPLDGPTLDGMIEASARWPAVLRLEATAFAAVAARDRLRDSARAERFALLLARDAEADAEARKVGFEIYYAAAHARGDLDGIRRNVLDDPRAPPGVLRDARRDLRRRGLHYASVVLASMGALASLFAFARAARRGRLGVCGGALVDRGSLGYMVLAIAGPSAIAELWARGASVPFLVLGAGLLAMHAFAASWRGAFGDRSRRARALGAVLALTTWAAVAYLTLERKNADGASLLEGFGL